MTSPRLQQYLSCMTLLSVCSATATIAQPAPLDAGQTLQDLRYTQPPPPLRPAAPAIKIQAPEAAQPPASSSVTIHVAGIDITGITRFPESVLAGLVKDAIGHDLTLAGLQGLAARITHFYRGNGYPVARAYLPPQEIRKGLIRIAVIEGRYGKVTIHHANAPHLPLPKTGAVTAGQVIAAAPLERELLLLSDLAGLNVHSTLGPGATTGTADLDVDIERGQTVSGTVNADNYGNHYTGRYRAGGVLNLANLAGRGDLFSLQGMTAGHNLDYGRLAYQAPVGSDGTQVGGAVSGMHYALGEEFAVLKAAGTARTATLFTTYPVIRSRQNNLWLQVNVDNRWLHDHIGATETDTDKHTRIIGLGVNGDHRGTIAMTTWSATFSTGHLDLNSPAARATDQVTARTAGGYGKLELNATQLVRLGDKNSLSLGYRGQLATGNLDSSEKFSLGGLYGVRAYAQDEAQSDAVHVLNAELRRDLTSRLQVLALADVGHGRINQNPWPGASGPNERTLSGIGLGANWQPAPAYTARVVYAAKLGPNRSPGDTSRGRLWFQVARSF